MATSADKAAPEPAVEDAVPSLADTVASHAAGRPQDLAFRFLGRHASDGRSLTWAELDQVARSVAADLRGRDLADKPVAIICPDPHDFLLALCGCFYAGSVAVPVPAVATRRSAGRIDAVFGAAKPEAVIARGAVLGQPWIDEIIRTHGVGSVDMDTISSGAEVEPYNGSPDRPALLQFTSGSTGTARGVVLSHRNLAANCAAIVDAYDLSYRTRGFSWLPLHHDMGLVGHILTPLWIGCSSTIMDPLLFLQSPLRWLKGLSETRATITSAPNFAYEMCARVAESEDLSDIDLSDLENAVCGGEPVWPETIERFCASVERTGFRRSSFAPSYGLAEATLLVSAGKTANGPQLIRRKINGSDIVSVDLGVPVRGVDVTIMDSEGGRCPDGQIGEIAISGACVGKPADGGAVAPDGQVLTGDLGFLSGGRLCVTGRRKELIILRGQNVYPADVENVAVRSHERVAAGSVAAIPVRRDGTESLAVLFEVKRPVPPVEELENLCKQVREAVTRESGHAPSSVAVVSWGALPRTTSGKVRRSLLATDYTEGRLPLLAGVGQLP